MNASDTSAAQVAEPLKSPISEDVIAQLVGQVYECAPPVEQSRLIECLVKPLGVLSLAYVANGIFANLLFRGEWPQRRILPEDAQNVQVNDVISLVQHVQQVSVSAVNSLIHVLSASPVMTGSAAAAVLMTVLMQRAKHRRASDLALGDVQAA